MGKMSNRSVFGILGVTALGLALFVGPVRADVISDWNAKAQAIQVEKQVRHRLPRVRWLFSTLPSSRP